MAARPRDARRDEIPSIGVALLLCATASACFRTPLEAKSAPENPSGHKLAWQGPEPIEDFANLSYDAHVVMDFQGNVTAVWRQYVDEPRSEGVAANRFDQRVGAWGQARFIDDGKHDATVPTLAMDGQGTVAVVWEQTGDFEMTHDVHGARFEPTLAGWRAPELLTQTDSRGMIDPVVGLDRNGDGIVVWLESNSGHSLHASTFVGGAWAGPTKLLDQRSTKPSYPRLTVDGDGGAILMWAELDGPHSGLYLRRIDPEIGEWGSDIVLSSEPCYAPSLAADRWGTSAAAATWLASGDSSGSRLRVAYQIAPDGDWQEESLPDTISATATHPAVAVSRKIAVLLWRQGEAQDEIYASHRGADGMWRSPVLLGGDAGPNTIPRAEFDGNGNIIATWHQGRQGNSRVVAARYSAASESWSAPVLLDNGDASAEDPIIAVNGAGQAVVIWRQQSPSFGHLWANRWQ